LCNGRRAPRRSYGFRHKNRETTRKKRKPPLIVAHDASACENVAFPLGLRPRKDPSVEIYIERQTLAPTRGEKKEMAKRTTKAGRELAREEGGIKTKKEEESMVPQRRLQKASSRRDTNASR
ncbi:hypothetical protein X777_15019, partial [Ooceraea biroi]